MRRHTDQLLVGFFLILNVCTASGHTTQRPQHPIVKIEGGLVEGARSPDGSKLVFFRGIP